MSHALPEIKQGVALTGRNRTVPPCNVGRRTGHACYRRRQTTPTDNSVQNNTGPLGRSVKFSDLPAKYCRGSFKHEKHNSRRTETIRNSFASRITHRGAVTPTICLSARRQVHYSGSGGRPDIRSVCRNLGRMTAPRRRHEVTPAAV